MITRPMVNFEAQPYTTASRTILLSGFSLWNKLILFVFGLMLLDSTNGFDTGLSDLLVVRLMGVSLRPQEILIVLAAIQALVKPKCLNVLLITSAGRVMLVFFIMVLAWTGIRILQGEASNMLLRMYLGWIITPIALCIVFRKWENVVVSFYMVLATALVGFAIMSMAALLGVDFISHIFPYLVQRAPEAYSAHTGFSGQSSSWVQLLLFYITAGMLFTESSKHRLQLALFLFCMAGLDVITMGRGRLIFNMLFLLIGLVFIAPSIGLHFRNSVRTGLVLVLIAFFIVSTVLSSGLSDGLTVSLKSRYLAGIDEVMTKSGSFAKHYLAPFEKFELLKKEGIGTLFLGAGPTKESEIHVFYEGEKVSSFSLSEPREISSDSPYATLLGWYGLAGLFLSVFLGIVCLKTYLKTPGLDRRFKYVGAINSIALLTGGIFVAYSACTFEPFTLTAAWAAIVEYNHRLEITSGANIGH